MIFIAKSCVKIVIYESNPHKVSDPIAVAAALSVRKQLGESGTTGLTELCNEFYSMINQKGKTIKHELLKLNIKSEELERQFAIIAPLGIDPRIQGRRRLTSLNGDK